MDIDPVFLNQEKNKKIFYYDANVKHVASEEEIQSKLV